MLNRYDADGFTLHTRSTSLSIIVRTMMLLTKRTLTPPFELGRNVYERLRPAGISLLCRWTNGSTQWLPLKDLADEAYTVQVTEYAKARRLVNQPAFKWWVPYNLRKRL